MVRFRATVNPRLRDLEDLGKFEPHEMRKILASVDSIFRKRENKLFATEGASAGAPWQPLSEPYATYKRKRYGAKKILQRTGKLRRALVNRGGSHRKSFSTKPRPLVVVGAGGAPAIYGAHHAEGSGSLPVRDPIDDSPAAEREYAAAINDELLKKVDRVRRALARGARFGRVRRSA